MADLRGKRGKKPAWQVSLGVKEILFGLLGIAGLMMMSFALGALAGRGDIFVMAHRWGLMGPEAAKVAQAPMLPPVPPQVAAITPPAAAPAPPVSNAPPGTSSSPAPAAARKPAAKNPLSLQKQKEEELRKLREELARKARFINSQDHSRPNVRSGKGKGKEGERPAPQGAPAPVTVARFRDKAQAQAKLAELKKQGQKVALKEGRDQKGVYYAVVRPNPAGETAPQAAAAKPDRPAPTAKPKKAAP